MIDHEAIRYWCQARTVDELVKERARLIRELQHQTMSRTQQTTKRAWLKSVRAELSLRGQGEGGDA